MREGEQVVGLDVICRHERADPRRRSAARSAMHLGDVPSRDSVAATSSSMPPRLLLIILLLTHAAGEDPECIESAAHGEVIHSAVKKE